MKIVTIVGARPQFIKAAAVSRAFQHFEDITEKIVHTGQHYDHNMSRIFFEEMQIPEPAYNLEVGSGSHGKQTGLMLERIEKVLLDEHPDILLIYGDTNSTLAGALAAGKLHIPVAHVEAGLRSFNRLMPEEINRVLSDHVSDYLFCPTQTAVDNLKGEGIEKGVHLVGDVMYDCALFYAEKASGRYDPLKKYNLTSGQYILATIHRAETTDNTQNLKSVCKALEATDAQVLLPLHPRTRNVLHKENIRLAKNILVTEPVSYLEMILLEKNAQAIMTDSGGIQKEAYFFETPCITLRTETEWVETVSAGWNHVTGLELKEIIKTFNNLKKPDHHPDLYGTGRAAEKIVDLLRSK